MVCKYPYLSPSGMAHGCGGCAPCRKNRKRIWVHRIMLESLCHESNLFLTLTYNDDTIPKNKSLEPEDVTKFLKRLRKAIEPVTFRYYLAGEYGHEGERGTNPHYHAVMFGLNSGYADTITRAWGKGFCYFGDVTKDSASYVAGYVLKPKREVDKVKELGLVPEFSRMSLRPKGIGAGAIGRISEALRGEFGHLGFKDGDVPNELAHGGVRAPLGRYLKQLLRAELGMDKGCPDETMQALRKQFQEEWQKALQKRAKKQKWQHTKGSFEDSREEAKKILVEHNQGRINSSEAKERLFGQKRKIL